MGGILGRDFAPTGSGPKVWGGGGGSDIGEVVLGRGVAPTCGGPGAWVAASHFSKAFLADSMG